MSSDQVILRSFNSSDIDSLSELLNNKKIWDQLRDYLPHPYSREDAEQYINSKAKEKPILTFAVEMDNKLIGNISLKPQKDIHRHSAALGYWIGEPYWGNGYATLAIQKIVTYGFQELKLSRIFATVMENNPGSMKALTKSWFKLEGISKKGFIKNDRYLDEHRFAVLNPEIFNEEQNG